MKQHKSASGRRDLRPAVPTGRLQIHNRYLVTEAKKE